MAHILLVDDSAFTRKVLKGQIEIGGHEVAEAGNGQEGLDRIISNKPDCLVTDLLMPVMDGFGLLEGLKEQGISLPIIVLSADIQDSTSQKIKALGTVTTFLHKPPNFQDLLKAIDDCINT